MLNEQLFRWRRSNLLRNLYSINKLWAVSLISKPHVDDEVRSLRCLNEQLSFDKLPERAKVCSSRHRLLKECWTKMQRYSNSWIRVTAYQGHDAMPKTHRRIAKRKKQRVQVVSNLVHSIRSVIGSVHEVLCYVFASVVVEVFRDKLVKFFVHLKIILTCCFALIKICKRCQISNKKSLTRETFRAKSLTGDNYLFPKRRLKSVYCRAD
jgi:hypothetical protein